MEEKYKFCRNGKVKMQLIDDPLNKKWRSIGEVKGIGRGRIFVRYENRNGLHVKTDSFSLPYTLLHYLLRMEVEEIYIIWERQRYTVSVNEFLQKGQFMHFKESTERKLYLQRKDFYK